MCFNHGATDADNDSLVYSLVMPRQTATTTVNYIAPYTSTNPIASSPAFQFNQSTGDVCFTPTQLQVTVMAVLVKEYRNGVLIGEVVRDIQVTVLNCINDLPTLTGINGTNNFSTSVCANTPLCFNVFSNDPDANQQVSISYNQAISGANFSQSGTPFPTGTFCWTPTTSDISSNPYCFTLTVKDNACPYNGLNTYSYCVTVNGLTVNAGPDQQIACSDLATISAQVSGATGPLTYQWSNGFTGPTQTVSTGTYVVTVSDGSCTASDTVVVSGAFEPTAAFTASAGCVNTPIQFTDQSTSQGGIISWWWNFGGGQTSTTQNPVHTFPSPGTYNVMLVVGNVYGCLDTVIQPVTISAAPQASFTATNGCAGQAITFTNTSTPPGSSWSWTFSNGSVSNQQNPSVVFAMPGNYNATLVVTDASGCAGTIVQPFTVNPLPIAQFSASGGGCQGAPVVFTNQSSGGQIFQWNFGDSTTSSLQNPSHIFSGSGTYAVSLLVISAAGCSSMTTVPVQVNTQPLAYAGPDESICLGGTVTLNASGGVSYTWNPGGMTGSTVSVSPVSNTTYSVVVTDGNGCTGMDSVTVIVNPLPVPTISPAQSVCQGQSVTLIAGGGVSYSWNPSGVTNDTLVVTPNGSMTYAVNALDANGCQGTAFTSVTVQPNPVLNLAPAVFICSGVNATLGTGFNGTTYQWSTGATTPTISVGTQGSYTVTVSNSAGCTATATTQVTVAGTTVSNNAAVSICQGQTATLQAGQNGVSYQWSTGAVTPSIVVGAAGTYSVTVTDANGCTGVIAHTVQVNPLPQAIFTPQDECLNDTVWFFDMSTVNGGTLQSWSWDLGDGNISFAQNPTHVYNNPGSYVIGLTIVSNSGCTSTLTDTLNIYPMPTALFAAQPACEGSPMAFTDQSTVGFGNIVTWNWNFGDGSTSTQQNPQHAYTASGTYLVTLEVMTPGGCRGEFSTLVQVYPRPDLSFSPAAASLCSGGSINLTNTSTSSSGNISAWQWNLGNGQTSTQYAPSVVYPNPGNYTITLIGTTSLGCSDTATGTVTVFGPPTADAGLPQSICFGQSVTLTATGGVAYEWSPTGAITSGITVSPSATLTYSVLVTDQNGCTATDSVRVQVNTPPVVLAGADQIICTGGSAALSATGAWTYSWSPGGATTASLNVSPVTTTTYTVTGTAANGCTATDTVVVSIETPPVFDLGPDTSICEGTTILLTAFGGSTYYWSHNGANTASVPVSPTSATTYTVTATSANGCSAMDSLRVQLNPTPQITGGNVFYCSGFSITLDAGLSALSYEWQPNGETSQSITVSTPGTYTVLVTSAGGCIGSGTFNVIEGGSALNQQNQNVTACDGQQAILDAGNPGMSYLWSTGATTQTISVNSGGAYSVTVTDPSGCSASFVNQVTLNPLPQASFLVNNACEGSLASVQNLTQPGVGQSIMSWQWSSGSTILSSTQNPQLNFAQTGIYPLQLVVVNGGGCADTANSTVSIYPNPVAAFTANRVCEGNTTVFTNNSSASGGSNVNVFWDFGDGNNSSSIAPQHNYTQAGLYTVNLVMTTAAGCADSVQQTVLVDELPVASFTATDVCEGDSTVFTNLSVSVTTLSDINWDFGDGNVSTDIDPVHRYTSPGVYTVSLTVGTPDGCENSYSKQVLVHPRPIADFAVPPVCFGQASMFKDSTQVNGGSTTGWFWDFGDGGFSSIQHPSHTYAAGGTYTVTLVATSNRGCTDTLSSTVQVWGVPQAQFGTTNACAGTPIALTDSSTAFGGSIISWNWNLGDGQYSTQQNPLHTYASIGTYNVQLSVTSSNGCTATYSRAVQVFPVPVANFSVADVCLNSPALFVDQSVIQGGGVFTYDWNFGDGSTSTDAMPQHLFQSPGMQNVTMTVTTPQGCSATVTRNVNVFPQPIAQFNAGAVCLNEPVVLNDQSSVTVGTITGWTWSLGDSTTSTAQNPTHFYTVPGTYVVSLSVISDQGCTASVTGPLEIFAPPTPMPVAGNGCLGNWIPFTDTSSGPNNAIVSWNWTFGDGSTSTVSNPSHVYTTAGTYSVELSTTNSSGCTARSTVSVIISPLPDAGFSASTACLNTPVQFNNSSVMNGGTITGYQWNFGDGSPVSSDEDPAHIYTNPGTYTVTLVVTNGDGCTDTITRNVVVNPLPVASFLDVSAAGCGPVSVAFMDASSIPGGSVVSWTWDFGDGTTSDQQNPTHAYTVSGSYAVSLTVTSDSGCTATYTQQSAITVYPSPVAEFEADPWVRDILDPQFNFINLSVGGLNYSWTFGDGQGSSLFEPRHTYRDTGDYMVTLWVTNAYGCTDSVRHPVRVNPIFSWWVPNAFTPNGDGNNEDFNVKGEYIANVELTIFNRWGEAIFYNEGKESAAWDGSVVGQSQPAKEDVYVFQVKLIDVWGKRHEKVGHVTLVR